MQDAAQVAKSASTTVGDLLDRALELRALREVAAAATRAPQAGREALREVGARLENLAAEVVQVRGKDELARAPAQREAAAGRHYRGLAAASAALAERIRAKRAELETAALQVEELQRAIAMREAFLADPGCLTPPQLAPGEFLAEMRTLGRIAHAHELPLLAAQIEHVTH